MSFRASANRVQNEALSPWQRLVALRSCFVCFSEATRTRFTTNLERFDTLYGFNRYRPRTDPPTEAQLLATLEALEAERSHWITQRQAEAQRNREAKRARKNAQRASAPSYLFGMPCATREQFERTIAKSKPTLVFFGASWDRHSTRMAIWLPSWKDTNPGWQLLVMDAQTEGNWDLYRSWGITNTPALLIYRSSREWARRVGFQEREEYSQWAKKAVE